MRGRADRRQPGLETRGDQLGEGRPRNQHAAIHVEWQAGEPRLPEQVRRRNALGDAPADQCLAALALRGCHPVPVGLRVAMIQREGVVDDGRGFVPAVGGAMRADDAGVARVGLAPGAAVASTVCWLSTSHGVPGDEA